MRRAAALALLVASLGCAHSPLERVQTGGFSLPTVDDQPYSLADQRGRVVLLSFFATWCFPCVAESGVLKRLQEKHAGALSVVAVGMDLEGKRVLKPFRDELQLPYAVLVADAATRKGESPFGTIQELPTTFVLDREGKVRDAFTGVPDEKSLEHLLAPLLEAR